MDIGQAKSRMHDIVDTAFNAEQPDVLTIKEELERLIEHDLDEPHVYAERLREYAAGLIKVA